jgi:hypothetical protein
MYPVPSKRIESSCGKLVKGPRTLEVTPPTGVGMEPYDVS